MVMPIFVSGGGDLIVHDSLSQGFDEFMNLVMDEAEEVYVKNNTRKQIG